MSRAGNDPQIVTCRNCALMLARVAYRRCWWFPLLREPLVVGMRMLAWQHRIDPLRHEARSPECKGCLRFVKAELEEKSATFRFLNDLIGRRFSAIRDAHMTRAELDEAKRIARALMGQG